MPELYESWFNSYENYTYGNENPVLPVKMEREITELGAGFGGFTTTFEVDDKHVGKLTRIVDIDHYDEPHKNEYDVYAPKISQRYTDQLVLAHKSDASEEEITAKRRELSGKLAKLGREKESIYNRVKTYMGDYLPEYYGVAIVDAPRKVFTEKRYPDMPKEIFDQIPTGEKTLMELYENVGLKNSLQNFSHEKLSKIMKNEDLREQFKEFANRAYTLLLEEKIMLDISDSGGVSQELSDNHHIRLTSLEDMKTIDAAIDRNKSNDAEEGWGVIYPRNVAVKDGKVKYFDTYPVHELPPFFSKIDIRKASDYIDDRDYKKLEQLFKLDKRDPDRYEVQLINYLYLLKYMGCDFKE